MTTLRKLNTICVMNMPFEITNETEPVCMKGNTQQTEPVYSDVRVAKGMSLE